MQYRITYKPDTGRPAETVQADHQALEAGGTSLVFRAVQRVAFQHREIVVRRLDAATVAAVEPA